MDSKDIIKEIDDFFKSSDEKALAEVNAAFSVVIDGYVSLEEYLAGFSNEYIYSQPPVSNRYTYSNKHLSAGGYCYQQLSFADTESNYEKSDLVMSLETESANKGQLPKKIKIAA
ncbi:MAG: hypothetical protein K2J18_00140 [Paramuribaculum sp.]|nr:hypothetical protein [Paramuribaculum sp.]